MSEWDLSAEVVVVGYGGAGVVAALAAREAGADVLALDRYLGGGATDLSGGIVYAGGGTWVQRAAGVEDTVDTMYAYLRGEVGEVVSEATLRSFCAGSPAMIDWLTEHGVPFDPSSCPYKTSYPTDDYYLYYSGSENSFPDRAVPRQRGHRAHGPGVSGKAFYRPLAASAARAVVRVRTGTRVTDLVLEEGRVVGVEAVTLDGAPPAVLRRFAALTKLSAKPGVYHQGFRSVLQALLDRLERRHGRTIRIRATSSVIITTGGFIANRAMVAAHRPDFPWDEGLPLGTAADDGSGITMGCKAGAAVDKMDHISNWRFIGPPSAFFAGLAVGSDGRRMIDESRYGAALGDALATRPDHCGWLLVDAPLLAEARRQIPQQSTWFQRLQTERLLRLGSTRGATLDEVATRAGVDPAALHSTVDAHNRAIEDGVPDPFGKPDAVRRPIGAGPFTLLDISFRARTTYPMPMLTLGGLVVDEETGAVLRPDGAPVPGLFAAGRAAVGICSDSYVSGLSLADCVFSGRRAGAHGS